MDFRLEVKGGGCVSRYFDREAPEAFGAAGFDDQSWRAVSDGLAPSLYRFYQDNFTYVVCATLGSIPIIIGALLAPFYAILLLLVPLWGVFATSVWFQERFTIPRRLSKPIANLNEQLFNPKGLVLSYQPGFCFGFGAYFRVTPVKKELGPVLVATTAMSA